MEVSSPEQDAVQRDSFMVSELPETFLLVHGAPHLVLNWEISLVRKHGSLAEIVLTISSKPATDHYLPSPTSMKKN